MHDNYVNTFSIFPGQVSNLAFKKYYCSRF